jgi:ribosomal-protein-alanine N-acetyltransferase
MRREASIHHLSKSGRHLELQIEPITVADLNQVMRLERVCFSAPWSRRMFREELEHPWAILELARLLDSSFDFEAVDRRAVGEPPLGGFSKGGPVVGYTDYWLVHEEVHLLSVAVHPGLRNLGLGRLLVERSLEATRFIAGRRVSLEVRRSNVAARRLYESLGFRLTGVQEGYYRESGEDALIMQLDFSSKPARTGAGPKVPDGQHS